MHTDRPVYHHTFSVCPVCSALQTAARPCGCRHLRLPADTAPVPNLWLWLAFGLAGWGLIALLYVGGKGLVGLLSGLGW